MGHTCNPSIQVIEAGGPKSGSPPLHDELEISLVYTTSCFRKEKEKDCPHLESYCPNQLLLKHLQLKIFKSPEYHALDWHVSSFIKPFLSMLWPCLLCWLPSLQHPKDKGWFVGLQWFLTFLTRQPFNSKALHAVATPTMKSFSLGLQKCNFVTVLSHNANI